MSVISERQVFVYRLPLFYTLINIIGVKRAWIIKYAGNFMHMRVMKKA
jgi:hypothetical protein